PSPSLQQLANALQVTLGHPAREWEGVATSPQQGPRPERESQGAQDPDSQQRPQRNVAPVRVPGEGHHRGGGPDGGDDRNHQRGERHYDEAQEAALLDRQLAADEPGTVVQALHDLRRQMADAVEARRQESAEHRLGYLRESSTPMTKPATAAMPAACQGDAWTCSLTRSALSRARYRASLAAPSTESDIEPIVPRRRSITAFTSGDSARSVRFIRSLRSCLSALHSRSIAERESSDSSEAARPTVRRVRS